MMYLGWIVNYTRTKLKRQIYDSQYFVIVIKTNNARVALFS